VTSVVLGVIALVLLLALIWWSQERILFQPPAVYDKFVETGRVSYSASDGQALVAYVVGEPQTASGVLLCFHGNADLSVWQLDWARAVASHTGYAVFLAEYRGYLGLGGDPTYFTTRLDAIAAYSYVRSVLGVDDSQLAYFGHSLGSAVAAELAQIHRPNALLLQSPFSSARAMARLIVTAPLALLWRVVSRIHFDTAQVVSHLNTVVAVAHGRRDRIVPFRMGVEVYQAAKIKGPLLVVDAAGHSDVPVVAGERYWKWLSEALAVGMATSSNL
jgi:fermentation-respiration switch protein FrsA (DUF1100 family)